MQRCSNGFPARKGEKALSRWQRDKWYRDGCKDCRQDKEKEKSRGRGEKKKPKMTTKWNLINPDLVPSSDKFSAEEEEEGKLFFWDVFSSPPPFPPFSSYHSAFPPGLKRQRDVWVLTMLLLHLWND